MTDQEILSQADADFDAALDPANPNSALVAPIKLGSQKPSSACAMKRQTMYVAARIKQAVRVAGTLP